MAAYLTESATQDPAERQAAYLSAGAAPVQKPGFADSYHLYAQIVLNGATTREKAETWLLGDEVAKERAALSKLAPLGKSSDSMEASYGWLLSEGYRSVDDIDRLWTDSIGRQLKDAGWSAAQIQREGEGFRREALDWAQFYEGRKAAIELAAEKVVRERFAEALEDQARAHQKPLSGAEPRRDIDYRLARHLRIAPGRNLTVEELTHILSGKRADGQEIEGVHKKRKLTYYDFTWSAPKSFSVAHAFSEEREKALWLEIQRGAADAGMRYLETQIGWAWRGDGGKDGAEEGRIAWFRTEHHTSRPVKDYPTERLTLGVAADPNLHSHSVAPNVVLAHSGHVGALDTAAMHARVKVAGRLFQVELATRARKLGAEVSVDMETGAARISAIPPEVEKEFSKRTTEAEKAAQDYAKARGLDWQALPEARKVAFIKAAATKGREHKELDAQDQENWKRQAAALGWAYKPTLLSGVKIELAPEAERLDRAYEVALHLVERDLARSAVIERWQLEVAALSGLIEAGSERPEQDKEAVVQLMRERGVRQDGQMTRLMAGPDEVRFTTEAHVGTEREIVRIAQAAHADKSAALRPEMIAAAIARSPYDFTTDGGKQQREMVEKLASGGRLGLTIGAGGAGKTAATSVLVDAWHRDGREVIATALASRQADRLAKEVGADRRYALLPLIERAGKGEIPLSRNTVMLLDEVGQIGSTEMAALLRLQERTGCQVVAIGDHAQTRSPSAGGALELLYRSLGAEAVPRLSIVVRQEQAEEREMVAMFRHGQVAEALSRKDQDRTLEVVAGGYAETVRRVAKLWEQRRQAAGGDVTVSAPTNADARAISEAIRERRKAAGEIEPDMRVVQAIDPDGAECTMALAKGDRVRVYRTTNAMLAGSGKGYGRHDAVARRDSVGRHGAIGRNGSVLEVLDIGTKGVRVRNAAGTEGIVKWEALTDKASGRLLLSYADCATVHVSQGITSTEHIAAMPAGSQSVDAAKGYVQNSRHRRKSWIVTSEAAELGQIRERRALGDEREITRADILKNMAHNMSRREEKASALLLVEPAFFKRQRQAATEAPEATAAREKIAEHQARTVAERIAESIRSWRRTMPEHDATKPVEKAEQRSEAQEPQAETVEAAVDGWLRVRGVQEAAQKAERLQHRIRGQRL